MDNILKEIKNKYKSFSKMHRVLADYILNNSEVVINMSLKELSQESKISEATIIRFTHVLGLNGYIEFQNELKNSIKYSISTLDRLNTSSEINTKDLILDNVNKDIENIRSSYSESTTEKIVKAAKLIDKSNNIYILGLRTSNILSQYLGHYLNMMEFNVFVVESTLMEPFEQISKMNGDDILISYSFPRYSQNTIKCTNFAYNKNYPVIAITDSEDAPISKCSTIKLIAKIGMSSFIDSLVAGFALTNSLIIATANETSKDIEAIFKKLENYWKIADTYEEI